MTLLTRYLLRNNLFLLFSILLIGTGLYILTDLFERLDTFLDSSFGLFEILWFYSLKAPFIIGQILPAVFLVAIIVQFCLMAKTRELVALQAGGVSPFSFLRFLLLYSLIWAIAQLMLAQLLGVEGDREAARLWKEEVRGSSMRESRISALWFIDKSYVVHLGVARPAQGTGDDFLAYQLTEDGKHLKQMIRAESFSVRKRQWTLRNAVVLTPDTYGYEERKEMTIPLTQDLASFAAIDPGTKPVHLPIWRLREAIANLEKSGSNVEVLRTTYYSHFAYAASIMAMGILGLAIVLWRNNIYIAVATGLLLTFVFYACNTLFISLGERGLLMPLIAAWFPVAFFSFVGLGGVLWRIRPRFRSG